MAIIYRMNTRKYHYAKLATLVEGYLKESLST